MPRARYDPSPDRKRLGEIHVELGIILERFCEHEPVLRGTVETFRRRCGKPNCRCAGGQLHETLVIVDRSSGRRRLRKLSRDQLKAFRKPTEAYRSLRRLRSRLGKLHLEALELCDRLCRFRAGAGEKLLWRVGLG